MKTKKTSSHSFKASANKNYRYKAVIEKISGLIAVSQISVLENNFLDQKSPRQFKSVTGKTGFISTHSYDKLAKKKYKELYYSDIDELANLSSFLEKKYRK